MELYKFYLIVSLLWAQIYGVGGSSIIINSPDGGARWFKGTPCQGILITSEEIAPTTTITWTLQPTLIRTLRRHTAFFKYNVDLYTPEGNLVSRVATNISGFNYCWQIPETLPSGSYKIRISTPDNLLRGESSVFAITNGN